MGESTPHNPTPHPGWGIPRCMDGGGPVDAVVTSPYVLAAFIPRSPAFPRTHLGPLLQTAIKIKRLRVRSSHIVESKADIELRSNREEKNFDQKSSKRVFYSGWLICRALGIDACGICSLVLFAWVPWAPRPPTHIDRVSRTWRALSCSNTRPMVRAQPFWRLAARTRRPTRPKQAPNGLRGGFPLATMAPCWPN